MRKITILLGFLILMPVYSMSYAQEAIQEATYPEIVQTSLPVNVPESNKQYDDLGSTLAVYSLIIGVYVVYWLKQKA